MKILDSDFNLDILKIALQAIGENFNFLLKTLFTLSSGSAMALLTLMGYLIVNDKQEVALLFSYPLLCFSASSILVCASYIITSLMGFGFQKIISVTVDHEVFENQYKIDAKALNDRQERMLAEGKIDDDIVDQIISKRNQDLEGYLNKSQEYTAKIKKITRISSIINAVTIVVTLFSYGICICGMYEIYHIFLVIGASK